MKVPPASLLTAESLDVPLATPRLRLEPLRPAHAFALFDGFRDERLYRWISWRPPASAQLLHDRWARLLGEAAANPLDLGWAVRRADDGAWIGKMDAQVWRSGVATNVGYLVFPPYWGRGYATEAVQALAAHLGQRGVAEQHATVTVGNDASCRVLERAGFARLRILAGNDSIDGQLVDDIEYLRRDRLGARPADSTSDLAGEPP